MSPLPKNILNFLGECLLLVHLVQEHTLSLSLSFMLFCIWTVSQHVSHLFHSPHDVSIEINLLNTCMLFTHHIHLIQHVEENLLLNADTQQSHLLCRKCQTKILAVSDSHLSQISESKLFSFFSSRPLSR